MPAYLMIVVLSVLALVAGGAGPGRPHEAAPPAAARPVSARAAADVIPRAAPAPAGLPVIDYWTMPHGFPADPAPGSTAALTAGLHPRSSLAVYDAPGGRPRALLPASISGLPVVAPIIARRPGWVAVLLPSVNRRIGWLPATGWVPRPLPDQLLVRRRTHELWWIHDGVRKAAWTVSVGTADTPTPLGRTFVLGRTTPHGAVYAGLDALVLGSVPDDRKSMSPGLRRAHTGIHSWYRDDVFGRSVSNGCIRMPGAAQQALLDDVAPGTTVVVID